MEQRAIDLRTRARTSEDEEDGNVGVVEGWRLRR